LEAAGSVFINKTVEGYSGARYHAGSRCADALEELTVRRAKQVFGAQYANVQPHSGTSANLAVYLAALKPGDTVLAMSLSEGGHLSHGHPLNFSGQVYRFYHYGVDRHTEVIDYDQVEMLALRHRPRLIVAGSSAYPRLIDWQHLRSIADRVSAHLMVDMAHISGLVAAGVIPSPVPHSDFVTSSLYKTLQGPRGGFILARQEFGPALDRAVFPGCQGTPILPLLAAKAVCFKRATTPQFVQMQYQVVRNAQALAHALGEHGLRLVTGGTDNHLVLVDLRNIGIKGNEAEAALESVGIVANRNLVPYDPEKPTITSGLRLGTPTVTNRGMGEGEMRAIADLIAETLTNMGDDAVISSVRDRVRALCSQFPMPGWATLPGAAWANLKP
jgi:glycine hydroxymethyltransferase